MAFVAGITNMALSTLVCLELGIFYQSTSSCSIIVLLLKFKTIMIVVVMLIVW